MISRQVVKELQRLATILRSRADLDKAERIWSESKGQLSRQGVPAAAVTPWIMKEALSRQFG